jgi:hypothetical protein
VGLEQVLETVEAAAAEDDDRKVGQEVKTKLSGGWGRVLQCWD